MNRFVLRSADGGPVTLSTLSGLPFWVLALLFAAITVIVIFVRRGKQPEPAGKPPRNRGWREH